MTQQPRAPTRRSRPSGAACWSGRGGPGPARAPRWRRPFETTPSGHRRRCVSNARRASRSRTATQNFATLASGVLMGMSEGLGAEGGAPQEGRRYHWREEREDSQRCDHQDNKRPIAKTVKRAKATPARKSQVSSRAAEETAGRCPLCAQGTVERGFRRSASATGFGAYCDSPKADGGHCADTDGRNARTTVPLEVMKPCGAPYFLSLLRGCARSDDLPPHRPADAESLSRGEPGPPGRRFSYPEAEGNPAT